MATIFDPPTASMQRLSLPSSTLSAVSPPNRNVIPSDTHRIPMHRHSSQLSQQPRRVTVTNTHARQFSCGYDAFQFPAILYRVLKSVPLWIQKTSPSGHYMENDNSKEDDNMVFYPRDILACSLVSKSWREVSFQILFFVHHFKYQHSLPKSLVISQSHRYRVFIDSRDFRMSDFKNLQNLSELDVRRGNGVRMSQMLQVLTRSPKLEKLYWRRIERADDKTENVMPRVHLEALSRLGRLRVLILDNWAVEMIDVIQLLWGCKDTLVTLGLGLTRTRTQFQISYSHEDEDIEAMVMQVRDLRLRLYQADDSACFDIVRFMPYLSCLRLDIPMGIDKQILISRLGMARTRLAILTNSAVILPSRLKSLEIYNHMALNSKEETDQQKNLIDSEIVALVEYAHPQGLKRLHLKVANISQTLADAIKTPPPTSSFSFSILQDLSLQITDFYSHSCNPIPWIHSILITCPQLRRIHLDLIGSQAKARVFMECAQELFYSPSEGDTQEPMVPWACSQTLQELTILGIQRPRVIDLVNYLDWNCQKPDTSGYMNKFWKKGRDRIHTIFLRSNSISQPNTSVLMNSSSNISHDSYNNKDEHERAHGQRPQPYQQQPPQALIELTRNEMRFNAQLAGQLAQCPNLIRFRLNSRSYMKELEHLRARHKVLKVEQQRVGAATMKLKAELMGN